MATQSWVNREYKRGAEHTPLWGSFVEDQHSGAVVSYLPYLGVARQEVQDLVAQGRLQTHGPSLIMSLQGTMVLKAEL
jgi:hypothetical protein